MAPMSLLLAGMSHKGAPVELLGAVRALSHLQEEHAEVSRAAN